MCLLNDSCNAYYYTQMKAFCLGHNNNNHPIEIGCLINFVQTYPVSCAAIFYLGIQFCHFYFDYY